MSRTQCGRRRPATAAAARRGEEVQVEAHAGAKGQAQGLSVGQSECGVCVLSRAVRDPVVRVACDDLVVS
jgi:hypothetical protein